jgi:PAS domain-containing protein
MEHYLHPSHRPAMREVTTVLALLVLGLLLAWALPLTDNAPAIAGYLPLHSLLETVSIVIAMMVFVVGWNDYQHKASVNLVPLASVFLGVACLDFSHIFAFPGMPDYATPNGPDKSIYFWLAARSMAALGMLAFVTFAWRQQSRVATRYTLLVAVLGMVGVLHWVFLFQVDSTQGLLLMPGVGLTPLKQYLEYSIIALNVAAAVILWRRMRTPQSFNAVLLFGAVCTMALSEVYFTLYAQATDVFNLLGHIYKLISYLFIYRVLVAATIEQPYRELSELQSAQQGMLDAIPDLLFEVDLSGRIDNYHSPRNDLLAAPPEVFIGKLFSEILPPEASQICLSALQEAAQNGWSTGKIYSLNLPQGSAGLNCPSPPSPNASTTSSALSCCPGTSPNASKAKKPCASRPRLLNRSKVWPSPMHSKKFCASTKRSPKLPAIRHRKRWAKRHGCSVQAVTTQPFIRCCGTTSPQLAPGKVKFGTDEKMARSIPNGCRLRP